MSPTLGMGTGTGRALDADGYGDVEVVDDTVAVEILEAEVRGEDDGAGAEDVDEAVGVVALELAAEAELVLAEGHGETVVAADSDSGAWLGGG